MNLKDYLLSNHNIKNYLTIILTIVFTKSRLCESQISHHETKTLDLGSALDLFKL